MKLDLQSIFNDNQSGSYTLNCRLLERLRIYIADCKNNEVAVDESFDELHHTLRNLIKHQPNMVLLRKSVAVITSYFKRSLKNDKSANEIYQAVDEKIQSYIAEMHNNSDIIAKSGAKIITNFNKILTISNSTLVKKVFDVASHQKRKFEVYSLKSDPPGEGIGFAESLSEMGLKVHLLADSQAGIVMNEMNLVLIGADRLYEDGLINKSGTLALCLLARYFNTPVYLVAETVKILKVSERSIKYNFKPVEEVYSGRDDSMSVVNRYFEEIPYNLINRVISEEGVFETREFISWYLGD